MPARFGSAQICPGEPDPEYDTDELEEQIAAELLARTNPHLALDPSFRVLIGEVGYLGGIDVADVQVYLGDTLLLLCRNVHVGDDDIMADDIAEELADRLEMLAKALKCELNQGKQSCTTR